MFCPIVIIVRCQSDATAASAKASPTQEPELMQRWHAKRLDCYLYAQDDQYA